MELYTAGTGNGQRAAIAVNECGVSCDIHVFNLGKGDQKAADYLKINPTARIPTLIDPDGPGGKPLIVTQSWAVLLYLCEKTGKFLPADPVARVRMFQWMAEGAADYASVNQTIFFLGNRMPDKVPDSAIKFYEDRFVNLWRFADDQLAKTPYLAGNEITAADLAVYPIYAGRRTLPTAPACSICKPGASASVRDRACRRACDSKPEGVTRRSRARIGPSPRCE
jgi:GSH-dependent disulfide-bond oxidoreductase